MKKLLLLLTFTLSFNIQAMYSINDININLGGSSTLIINGAPLTSFLNNKLIMLIGTAACILLLKKIFYSPKHTYRSQSQQKNTNNYHNNSIGNVTVNGVNFGFNDVFINSSVTATNGSTIIISDNPISTLIGWIIRLITNSSSIKQNTIYDAGKIEIKTITFNGIKRINGWGPGKLIIRCNLNGKEQLTISADKNILAILEAGQQDDTLNFGPQNNISFATKSPITYIALVKSLNNLSLSGELETKTIQIIDSNNLVIILDGSATLNSSINTNNLTIDCDGSSSATLKGKTLHQKINLDGQSRLDASKLISDSANIEMEGKSKAWFSLQKANDNRLKLTMDGSAILDGTIDVASLEIRCDGSSSATLKGEALSQKINLDGSSILNASKLTSNTAKATMDGSAQAWLSVQKTISYNIDGSSEIIYYGNPAIKGNRDGSAQIRPARFYE